MSIKVMIVDDQIFMRKSLAKIIDEKGWQKVGEASNGKEAVDLYPLITPDVVMMDITMPEMDGIAAVKAIKKLDPNASIIMVSAVGQQDMIIEAIQSGAKDFVVKPFQKDRVCAAIEKALGL